MVSVLLVEDEEAFVEALMVGLQREGFELMVARNGIEALQMFGDARPDVVLLDVMLPNMSGIDVCRQIRAESDVPIIMVTAKSSEIDTVVALEVGADDYVTKPYRLRELVARIRAVLRRRETSTSALSGSTDIGRDVIELGDVRLDVDSREVVCDGREVSLPRKEFDLLLLLMENAGRVVPRSNLIESVWGYDYVGDTKTLDVHIKRLRTKIEHDSGSPTRIVTARGVGYRYVIPK